MLSPEFWCKSEQCNKSVYGSGVRLYLVPITQYMEDIKSGVQKGAEINTGNLLTLWSSLCWNLHHVQPVIVSFRDHSNNN